LREFFKVKEAEALLREEEEKKKLVQEEEIAKRAIQRKVLRELKAKRRAAGKAKVSFKTKEGRELKISVNLEGDLIDYNTGLKIESGVDGD
jgi:EAL domain-containing protein (putative c-di-GMP-specific phosphodiesterase class I)